VFPDGLDQIVVNGFRNVVAEKPGRPATFEIAHAGVEIVFFYRRTQGGGQGVAMGIVGFIILEESFLAQPAVRSGEESDEVAVAEFGLVAVGIPNQAEFQVGVVELAEHLKRRLRHFTAHGQELLFAPIERMRLVAQDFLQKKPVLFQGRVREEAVHLRLGDRLDLRRQVTGQFTASRVQTHRPLIHRQVLLIGLVFVVFQVRIGKDPLDASLDIHMKLQRFAKRGRRFVQAVLKPGIAFDIPFQTAVQRFPFRIAGEERRQVPAVIRRHRTALRKSSGCHKACPFTLVES